MTTALAYTLWFVFAGFGNHQDPLYLLYKYEHLEGGWLAVGTLLTGGAIVKLFGAQLLPLRFFGWLCTVTAITLPYCCLLDKEQRRENLHWLAMTFFLMGYGAFQEFSPGALSVLLLSAIWVTAVKSPLNPQPSTLNILSAIILGLAIAVRFPNILALLILIPLWKRRCLWNIPIAAITAGIVYLLGYLFITPASTDVSMMASHDIWNMLEKLWTNSGKLAGALLLSVGVLAIGNIKSKYSNLPILSGILVGLALALFIAYAVKPKQWYNVDLTYLVSALCLVVALYAYITHRTLHIAIGALLLSVTTLGTDTAWLKLFPAVLCLLPVAATYYTWEYRRYLCCVMAAVSVCIAVRMTANSIGQSDLTKATTVVAVSPYKGIAIREAEEQRLEQYIADYESLNSNSLNPKPSTILAIGQEMHLMRAVMGCEAAKYNEFWSNIFDSVYTAKYREVIQREHPIVFCSYTPQFKTKKTYEDEHSAFEEMLREEGYTTLDRAPHKYMIYIPETHDQEIQ